MQILKPGDCCINSRSIIQFIITVQSKMPRAKQGEVNSQFLQAIDAPARDEILANIAGHYRISKSAVLAEVTDPEAEGLLEYMVGPARMAASALMQRYGFR